MANIPGIRSPYARVGRIVYFGRMLDKARLHAVGKLPADYAANLGEVRPLIMDARCCRFLGMRYEDIIARIKSGETDAQILSWVEAHGTKRTDEDCVIWNAFMMKLSWRDDRSAVLQERIQGAGLREKPIETSFDFLDFDEGRNPVESVAWKVTPAIVIVIMGVAGSGKTTIGEALAKTLGWNFRDADEFHPAANIAKMTSGHPLTDADRAPWLQAIHNYIEQCLRTNERAIVTCSALKKVYRDTITVDPVNVKFVYLKGTPELLAQRIASRPQHFMKPGMLESQLETLEEPKDALTIDIAKTPDEIVEAIERGLGFSS